MSSGHVLPKVIQNSSISYAIGLATFGPLFAWGAGGNFLQAIIHATFLGLGLSLIYAKRRPMLEFLAGALGHDRSVTVHEFITRRHGNDPRVRLVAAALSVSAMSGLIICEALGMVTVLRPLLGDYPGLADLVIAAILAIVISCTMLSGHEGVMHAGQLQLGLLYFGLFGSTLALLYQQISDLGILPVRGNLAIAFIAVVCAVMVFYRRGRYVDTTSIRYGASAAADREPMAVWLLRPFQKFLNTLIGTVIVAAFVVIAIILYVEGFPNVPSDGAAALLADSNVPDMTLVSLILLPLFHPIVDVVNWQRLAAFEKDRGWSHFAEGQWAADFKRFCAAYAVEVPLIGLLICLFGVVAGLTLEALDSGDVIQALIAQLVEQENYVATTTLSFLLLSLFAMAVSTMSALFSAGLCTVRYDIVPMCWPEPTTPSARARGEAKAIRWTQVAGVGIGLVVFAAFYLADARFEITFASARFLALVFGFSCLQLSFVPLILGPFIIKSGSLGAVSPGSALAVMGVSAAIGIGATAAYLLTGYDLWLWAAVPGCLGFGALIFVTARLWLRRSTAAA